MSNQELETIIADELEAVTMDFSGLEAIVMAGLGGSLFPMPYHHEHLYSHLGYDFDRGPDMIADGRAYDLKLHNPRGYGQSYHQRRHVEPAPRVTKRDKVLAKRAKDKANRKRARNS